MSWYRAELPRDTSQLELMLGENPSADELKDFFQTEEQLNPSPSHLSSTKHHPLIKKPFRFTTPIPPNNAKYLRFKPARTYTSGIYISEDYETSIKERLNSIVNISENLKISIFTFKVEFDSSAQKKVFDVDSRSAAEQQSLYHDSDYELCNTVFETLAIDSNKLPKYNVVEYTSLRNPPKKNNLVYEISLLKNDAKDITTYTVIKSGNNIEVLDAVGVSKFTYSI